MGILGSIMALIQGIGWEMGISESIAMIIFVGLSVDYVVHIAHNYVESVALTRKER
jgi:predicted RND superfamily exporter protein